MSTPSSVTATFSSSTSHTLTVKIGGSSLGSVSSAPSGINTCITTCSASFTNGSVVTLTASPDAADGTFLKWRGDACDESISVTCQVTMTAAKTLTAVFSKTFTDATLTRQVTSIKAVHVTDLRNAIDMLRLRNGLGAFGWTDISVFPGSTPIKRQHLLELRTALDQAYAQAVKTHTPYAESITAGSTPIMASHLSELRTHVKGLE